MNQLWNLINEMKISKTTKNKIFLVVWICLNIGAGDVLWLAAGRMIMPGAEGLMCFLGYPAVFTGFVGGIIYLYNHELY